MRAGYARKGSLIDSRHGMATHKDCCRHGMATHKDHCRHGMATHKARWVLVGRHSMAAEGGGGVKSKKQKKGKSWAALVPLRAGRRKRRCFF